MGSSTPDRSSAKAVSVTLGSAESSEKMKLKVANECKGLTRKPCGGEVGTEVQLKWTEQTRKKKRKQRAQAAMSGRRW